MNAYIGIGSNCGDRENYINDAIFHISSRVGTVIKKSKIIETEPYGYLNQDNFLNCVIKIDTELSPRDMLKELNKIENELGRKRVIRWGPRTIDLDIIIYEDIIIDEDDLHIPHIDFLNRSFVMQPLLEIEPEIKNPRTGKKLKYEYIS